jgi:uncharacterized protein affecting Mg2+/Co2+ transport
MMMPKFSSANTMHHQTTQETSRIATPSLMTVQKSISSTTCTTPGNSQHISPAPCSSSGFEQRFASSLSLDFVEQLSPYSVIIGRQKACRDAVGNRRLQVLASTLLPKYAQANSRPEKSKIVSSLVGMIKQAGGSFVKLVDGKWSGADQHAAREKVGVVLRDLLHDKYRSSTKSKVAARRQRLGQQQDVKDDDSELLAPDDGFGKVWYMVE